MVRRMLMGVVVVAIGSLPLATLSWDGRQNNMAVEDLAGSPIGNCAKKR